MPDRRKIACLWDFSPQNPLTCSGGAPGMVEALQSHVGDVTMLDPGWRRLEPLRRMLKALPEPAARGALWRSQLALSRLIAPAIQGQLTRGRYDVLFCAHAFPALAGLRLPPGLFSVYTADTTPTTDTRSDLREGRAARLRPARLLEPVILGVERRVFRAMDLLLWPTEWLKSGADGLYGLDPKRSVIVPWGPNLADPGPVDLAPRISRG
ncbi:glycosyltransferase, partial [Leisingera sp.]|uniref:glycosyltransferase n=1 Tax=Leisingera sp. TaxID=1879318 RepID=UPI002B2669BC